MDPIKDIIPQVIANISQKNPEGQLKIERVWQNIIDEKLKNHTTIGGLKDKALIVHADSPACLFQLNLKRRKLLKQLKDEIPELEDIHFKIGKVK